MGEKVKLACEGDCTSYRLDHRWFGDVLICKRCGRVKPADVFPLGTKTKRKEPIDD